MGTAYAIRTGVESDAIAVDGALSGDAPTVNESCAEVPLNVR